MLNKILIGAMRLKDAESAALLIRKAIDYGFNYIDTAPVYRLINDKENSEAFVGQAVNYMDYRQRVFVSTKCATSNGRLELGSFEQQKGFGVRTAEQFSLVFQQSLNRLNLPSVDFYHLWICHTNEQFTEAFKPGGWYEGVLREKEAGRIKHLGLTTHADPDTIINFLKTGYFETVTIPLNLSNITRLSLVDYCREKGIKVIAMNPLGGGFLTANEHLKKLAYKFLLSLENVHLLIGFTSIEEVEYAYKIKTEFEANPMKPETILNEFNGIIPFNEPRCTGCGYCQPCPQFIDVGAALSHYNFYKYLHLEDAKTTFKHLQWNQRYRLSECIECGQCEKRCPNALPVRNIIMDAREIMYK